MAYKGRHVCMGYLYNASATTAAFDSEGYFLSGDVVQFSDGDCEDGESQIKYVKLFIVCTDCIIKFNSVFIEITFFVGDNTINYENKKLHE